jgi:hypothetical protein
MAHFLLTHVMPPSTRTASLSMRWQALYEYPPKIYSHLDGREPIYEKIYMDSMQDVQQHLPFRPMILDKTGIFLVFSTTSVSRGIMTLEPQGSTSQLRCWRHVHSRRQAIFCARSMSASVGDSPTAVLTPTMRFPQGSCHRCSVSGLRRRSSTFP